MYLIDKQELRTSFETAALSITSAYGKCKFDDETKQKLDLHSKSIKSKIDAETIKRAQGKGTTWKTPTTGNSQHSSTNTQSYSSHGNTYKSR